MKSDPLVSVIIPTYNRRHLVCEAIESVLCQTYSKLEVIVVDDGSTDETLHELETYRGRIRVFTQPNSGPGAARNRGVAACEGEFVAFVDSDDLWLPTKISRQVGVMNRIDGAVPCCLCNIMMMKSTAAITSFDMAWLYPDYEEGVWLNTGEVLADRFVLFNQGVMIRRKVLEEMGGFSKGRRLLEDYDLSLRLSSYGPWAFIREPLAIWRETRSSCSDCDVTVQRICKEEILEAHLRRTSEEHPNLQMRQNVRAHLRRVRRQLRADKIGRTDIVGAATLGLLLQKFERYHSAITRRSPWFPKMQAEPI